MKLNTEEKNKMICDKCGHLFDLSEAAIVYRKYSGVNIREQKCPECGGSFKALRLSEELDSYLYINDDYRYYTYPDKREN